MAFSEKVYTVEDYLSLNDSRRYELIGGELIVVPSPRPRHQRVSGKMFTQMEYYLKENPLGEVFDAPIDVVLGEHVVQPDILFISRERLDIVGELNIQGAPDLVVEVTSPTTAVMDRKKKSKIYWQSGVREYWVVDPEQQLVDVFVAGQDGWRWLGAFDRDDVLTTNLMPGLQVRLAEVFKAFPATGE